MYIPGAVDQGHAQGGGDHEATLSALVGALEAAGGKGGRVGPLEPLAADTPLCGGGGSCGEGTGVVLRVFQQGNTKASRKQVIPELERLLEGVE